MRQYFALLSLCKRFTSERVRETCARALASATNDYWHLERMLKLAINHVQPSARRDNLVPTARFLRPARRYAHSLASREQAAARAKEKKHDD